MRPCLCDAQDHRSEAEWRACPVCHPPIETLRDVFFSLVEAYRQAGQDAIHATWGESWPIHMAWEATELNALHGRCAVWLRRFAAAVDRGQGPSVPAAALRALLAELDGWRERPTNFGDACDRLSHLIAAYAGEETVNARASSARDARRNR